MRRPFARFLIMLPLVACAHGPGVASDELALTRVVVYRNGVGYFERAGHVKAGEVKFRVRTDHVGDFLATLTVMERGGSSVRSAAFPLHVEKPAPDAKDVKYTSALETVTLALDGGEHDLGVGYVAAQPVWRPSYRLVFGDGAPTLQAWGIVQNLSGEDWRNVTLSLVAGAPIAFEATLGVPVTPARPVLDDQGEVITSVPRAETTYGPELAPPVSEAAPEPDDVSRAMEKAGRPQAPMAGDNAPRRKAPRPAAVGPMGAPRVATKPALSPPPPPPSMPRDLSLLATATVESGTTRYDVPNRVTVPDDSATMVLLVARAVPGEEAFLFAPDAGVPDSAVHPFHVARFKNDTPGLLERGPIAVFDRGAFVGQGVIEPLAAGAETTVPFALERALAVGSEQKREQQGARLARIEAGQLTVERDEQLKTIYKLKNGGTEAASVIVRHPRQSGMRLVEPPKGTDDHVGEGKALVPVTVPARGQAELTLDERRAGQSGVDWYSNEAEMAVKGYLADQRADAAVAVPLAAAWGTRADFVKASQERSKLQSEQNVLSQGAGQARASLLAIARNKGAPVEALRKKLSERLTDLEKRLADVSNRLVEVDLKANELHVRFEEAVRDIKLASPLPPVGA